jgi:DNA-binding transcriptional MocR family regulator
VELPGRADGQELWKRALQAGVAIAPGAIFSARPQFGRYVRLSCGVTWSPRIDAAVATLGRMAGELR